MKHTRISGNKFSGKLILKNCFTFKKNERIKQKFKNSGKEFNFHQIHQILWKIDLKKMFDI